LRFRSSRLLQWHSIPRIVLHLQERGHVILFYFDETTHKHLRVICVLPGFIFGDASGARGLNFRLPAAFNLESESDDSMCWNLPAEDLSDGT
jgi:hypothetical protein